MAKELTFGDDVRRKIHKGVKQLYLAVSATLGPSGRNVQLKKYLGPPQITKDGVTVAMEVHLADQVEDSGAQAVKEASMTTGMIAGDGTTTAVVLAYSILDNGIKHLNKKNWLERLIPSLRSMVNAIEIKRGIDFAVKLVVEFIKANSEKINSDNKKIIHNVAMVSSNNDKEIADLISEVIEIVGPSGAMTVTDSGEFNSYIKKVAGMEIKSGFISPYFITDKETGTGVFDNPYVLVYDRRISNIKEMLPVIKIAIEDKRPLIVICDDANDEIIGAFAQNMQRSIIQCCLIRTPFSRHKIDILEDICAVTNSQLITPDKGLKLERVTAEDLGQVSKVVVYGDKTMIIRQEDAASEAMLERVVLLKNQIEEADIEVKDYLKSRINNISGNLAICYVGGKTETEVKEKKDRIDDAICATRAALEEGIVPGGGVTLLKAAQHLREKFHTFVLEESQSWQIGYDIVARSIEAPAKLILENSIGESNNIIDSILMKDDEFFFGFDARNDLFGDMRELGIIDPAKVTRVALESAASVAGLLLTTECVIANEVKTA